MLCVLPFVGVALWFLGGKNTGNLLFYGLILACPLSHMFFMKHNHHAKGGEHHHET